MVSIREMKKTAVTMIIIIYSLLCIQLCSCLIIREQVFYVSRVSSYPGMPIASCIGIKVDT